MSTKGTQNPKGKLTKEILIAANLGIPRGGESAFSPIDFIAIMSEQIRDLRKELNDLKAKTDPDQLNK